MTVPVMVSEHDLLGLLGIVSDHRDDDPGDGLPLSLLEHLMQHVPCDEISFVGLDSKQRAMWFGQGIPPTGDGDMDAFWAHYWDSLPCSYPDRCGDLRSVTRVSDFYSARQWHATGMYCDYLRPAGYEHEIILRLVAEGLTNGQISRRLGVSEGTIRKHLENIYARLRVSSRAGAVTRAFQGTEVAAAAAART